MLRHCWCRNSWVWNDVVGEVQMSRIVDVKAGEFARFVAKGSCAVLFSASWCKPCQEMKPVFNELAEKLQSCAAFGKIDVAVSPTISQMYGIRSDPSLAIFHEGRLRLVLAGSRSAAALKKAILADLKDVL